MNRVITLISRWRQSVRPGASVKLPEGPISIAFSIRFIASPGYAESAISSPSMTIYPADPGAYWLGQFWKGVEATMYMEMA